MSTDLPLSSDTSGVPPVTALYVPGDRPDRFDTALSSGAGMLILDLEDAVPHKAKDEALANVLRFLDARAVSQAATPVPIIQVRVNHDAQHELEALAAARYPIELRIPKVESASQLDNAAERSNGLPITALLESARGVESAVVLAAHPAVTRLALGESDLRSELAATAASVIEYARIRLVYAAAAARLPAPMMSAYPHFRDIDGLLVDSLHGRALGCFGRSAIHPMQLSVIEQAFQPDAAEIAWADEVLFALADGGVSTLDSGEMVDRAMIGRAREIQRRADAATR